MTELLPWFEPLMARLHQRIKDDTLPHALLLCGPNGLGKALFAKHLCALLLCEKHNISDTPCGECRGCQLMAAGTHPDTDFITLEINEKTKKLKQAISVDQIRQLSQKLTLTAHYAGYKPYVISPAHRMNINAANSLLKTLEEPPPKVILILVTDKPNALPATIRSRCQRLDINPPAKAQALAWLSEQTQNAGDLSTLLNLAEGAPLNVIKALEEGGGVDRMQVFEDLQNLSIGRADPIQIAQAWEKAGGQQILQWLYLCVVDMIKLKEDTQTTFLNNPDLSDKIITLTRAFGARQLHSILDRLSQNIRLLDGPMSSQCLLEDVLDTWALIIQKNR